MRFISLTVGLDDGQTIEIRNIQRATIVFDGDAVVKDIIIAMINLTACIDSINRYAIQRDK